MAMTELLTVTPTVGEPYPVLVGDDAAAALAAWPDWRWRQAVVIADETTDALFGDAVEAALAQRAEVLRLSIPVGEATKTRATKERLEDAMLSAGIERNACVVGLGGGIPLDVAGFVAATYLRGVDHLNVATTLLAQVDAAVGGKTAVNTQHGKNLIGAFHQPRAVLVDVAALGTLSELELRNGLAEAIKHAVLADRGLFRTLERWTRARGDSLVPPRDVIGRCVAIKAEVVADDALERGKRSILNFGHTVAHAIERATDFATPHGHAVAIGMVVEARLAANEDRFPAEELERLMRLLTSVGLPVTPPCPFADAEPALEHDKKTVAGAVRCAIPSAIGRFEGRDWTRAVEREALAAAWS